MYVKGKLKDGRNSVWERRERIFGATEGRRDCAKQGRTWREGG